MKLFARLLVTGGPPAAMERLQEGIECLDDGEVEQTAAACSEAIRLAPEVAPFRALAHGIRAMAYASQSHYDQALDD